MTEPLGSGKPNKLASGPVIAPWKLSGPSPELPTWKNLTVRNPCWIWPKSIGAVGGTTISALATHPSPFKSIFVGLMGAL